MVTPGEGWPAGDRDAHHAPGFAFPCERSAASIAARVALERLAQALRQAGVAGRALERLVLQAAWAGAAQGAGALGPDRPWSLAVAAGRRAAAWGVARLPALGLPWIAGWFEEPWPDGEGIEQALVACAQVGWEHVSPGVLGDLVQTLMAHEGGAPHARRSSRRELGAHYTSAAYVLRAIGPLFLEGLEIEADAAADDRSANALLHRWSVLRWLDPACGAGHFLLTAYVELRRLEWQVRRRGGEGPARAARGVRAEAFHGIELDPVAADVARATLWLAEARCDAAAAVGLGVVAGPATWATVVTGNALTVDWSTVLPARSCAYVMGNPPFVGAKLMSARQRAEARRVFKGTAGGGVLDYAAAWHVKAADYLQDAPHAQAAFVSTSSLAQGEQPGVLWPRLWSKGMTLAFAHQPFEWASAGAKAAAVHCIVLGFGPRPRPVQALYTYPQGMRGEPQRRWVGSLSPYLVEGPDVALLRRGRPLGDAPAMVIGNKPIDGGRYLFTAAQKEAFLDAEPGARPYFHRWVGSEEFLNGLERWCLWLGEADDRALAALPLCRARVEEVRQLRALSGSAPTQRLALAPRRFHVECFPQGGCLVVPETSSQRRSRVPVGYLEPGWLPSSLVRVIPGASTYLFGLLSSAMHNAWIQGVAGRMKSDYRYSIGIVYNNFPWPPRATDRHRERVACAAQRVLEARAQAGSPPLGMLYADGGTPADLERAHRQLDAEVDDAYGYAGDPGAEARVGFLLGLFVQQAGIAPRKTRPL